MNGVDDANDVAGARIAAQLAFYFSDANLRHSRHMQLLLRGGKPGGDFDARRWVSLAHVAHDDATWRN